MRAGQLLNNRYRLTDVIGTGGMSVVWRAHDEVLNRIVAVKVMSWPEADGLVRQRMLAEARSVALLSHPNVTSVYDYGEADGVPFVVMELLAGPTLSDRLAASPLPPREALTIGAQVASAVAAAHAHGLVHRDIKPANVVLTPAGAKVLDFGIAAFTGAPDVDADGIVLGTPAYLAPERMVADSVSPATDVFALGVLMYRLLTRDLPWPAETPSETIRAHESLEPVPLPPLVGVPVDVHSICRRCLDKDPLLRPSAAEVAVVLAAAAAVAPRPARRWHRRAAAVAWAVAAALVASAVILPILRPDHANPTAGPLIPTQTAPGPTGTDQPSSTSPSPSPASSGGGGGGGGQPVATPAQLPPPAAGGIIPSSVATTPTPPETTTTAPSTPAGVPLHSLGGTVYVRCDDGLALVVTIEPASGYVAQRNQMGPAHLVQVLLVAPKNTSQIKARCDGNVVIGTVQEHPSA
jgi:eukaryotic-like serine/threonine-protein kinase